MTSRFPSLNMMFGGTAIAAGLAALVVLPNIKAEFQSIGSRGDLVKAEADFGNDAMANRSDGLEIFANTPAPASEMSPARQADLVATSEALKKFEETVVLEETESVRRVTVPGQTAKIQTRVLANPASDRAISVPGKTATIQTLLVSDPARAREAVIPSDGARKLGVSNAEGYSAVIPASRDRFETVEDYPTVASRDEPVSTFSIDADTASYSFMRASLNRGQLPNPNSIRVEELINYFPYDYAAPTNADEPFKTSVTVTPTPWNADTKLMHIGIRGYAPPVAERPDTNIVLLIDTSGSMNNPNKLPLLINSFKLLLDTLGENDTVSIVAYAGSAGTVLEPTPANERATIVAAFDRLRAGGSTAGAAGLELAYQKAHESFNQDGINRVIVATDGDFNVGFSSPDEMKSFVEKKRETGVFLSVLGFGMGNYNDHLMQTLAQNGNGIAAYIDTLSEARKVLADETGGALIPIAKDVKIQVEFNPAQISEYRLIGYETRALKREDFNNDKVDAGDIGSGHTVTAIYELTPTGSPAELVDELRYAEAEAETTPVLANEASDEYAFVKIRYKQPDEDTSTLISRPVGAMDEVNSLGDATSETRFATSVAAFGQILRGGSRVSEYGYDEVIALASGAKGQDTFGYRAEFVSLLRLAKSIDTTR